MEAIALGADIALFVLPEKHSGRAVFEGRERRNAAVLSWCCIAEGALFAATGFWGFISRTASPSRAVFMGMILRVVKNVMEEAHL